MLQNGWDIQMELVDTRVVMTVEVTRIEKNSLSYFLNSKCRLTVEVNISHTVAFMFNNVKPDASNC